MGVLASYKNKQIEPKLCFYCKKEPAVISMWNPNGKGGFLHCYHCAQHLARGIMRDVLEIAVGAEAARIEMERFNKFTYRNVPQQEQDSASQ